MEKSTLGTWVAGSVGLHSLVGAFLSAVIVWVVMVFALFTVFLAFFLGLAASSVSVVGEPQLEVLRACQLAVYRDFY